ncbi:hypothetical protein ACF0H5_024307 [Mactra antiquata]
MDKSTEDCPCKRLRVSEENVDNETGMLVDSRRSLPSSSYSESYVLPTEGATSHPSTSLMSATQTRQARPTHTSSAYSGFWDFSEDVPCNVLERKPSTDLVNESHNVSESKANPYSDVKNDGVFNERLKDEIVDNVVNIDSQNLGTDTSNELLQHELFMGPNFQNVRKDANTSSSSDEPKVDKSDEKEQPGIKDCEQNIRYKSGACQYVQNVQAITENMHLRSRQDVQLVESIKEQIECRTVQSTETTNDSENSNVLNSSQSENSALRDNTSTFSALNETVVSAVNDSSLTVGALNEKTISTLDDRPTRVSALNKTEVSAFGDRSETISALNETTFSALDHNTSTFSTLNQSSVSAFKEIPITVSASSKDTASALADTHGRTNSNNLLHQEHSNADADRNSTLHFLLKQTLNPTQRLVDGHSAKRNFVSNDMLSDQQSIPSSSSNRNNDEVSIAGWSSSGTYIDDNETVSECESSCSSSKTIDSCTEVIHSRMVNTETRHSRMVDTEVTHPRMVNTEATQSRMVDTEATHPRMVDTGFIEMFTNSVMSSVFSGNNSSTHLGNAWGSRSLNSECGFSGLGDVLDGLNTGPSTSKMSCGAVTSNNSSSQFIGGSNSSQSDLNSTLSSEIFNHLGQGHLQVEDDVQNVKEDNQLRKNNDSAPECRYRKKNKLFQLSDEYESVIMAESGINSLPVCILLQVFKNMSIYCLLRRVGMVCKYWYNLCRDPDLWRTIRLTNQHRLEDNDLCTILKYSDNRVRSVNLTDCRFLTNKGIADLLASCKLIEDLKIIRCSDVTDIAFATLQTNEHLVYLNLDGSSRLTDNTLRKIAECCPNLQSLHLNHCTKVTNGGVNSLARNCHHIIELQLNHCCRVGDDALSEIVLGCPNITCLHLMSCGIGDTGVRYLSRLTALRNLDLSHVPRITSESVIYVSKYCKHLNSLNVSLNGSMDDSLLSQIAMNLKGLKRLYCVSCNVSDTGLKDIAKYCPLLEALDIGWCQGVTDHGVRVISNSCKHLEYFGLIRCDQVTIETVEELEQSNPHINYSTFVSESRRLFERAKREGYRFELS